jgi:hypothetical protein
MSYAFLTSFYFFSFGNFPCCKSIRLFDLTKTLKFIKIKTEIKKEKIKKIIKFFRSDIIRIFLQIRVINLFSIELVISQPVFNYLKNEVLSVVSEITFSKLKEILVFRNY